MPIDYEDVQYEDSVSSDTGEDEMSLDDMAALAEQHYEDQLANWSETGH